MYYPYWRSLWRCFPSFRLNSHPFLWQPLRANTHLKPNSELMSLHLIVFLDTWELLHLQCLLTVGGSGKTLLTAPRDKVRMYVHVCMCVYAWIFAYMYTWMYVCTYVHVCMCVCSGLCINTYSDTFFVYMYVCTYVRISKGTQNQYLLSEAPTIRVGLCT